MEKVVIGTMINNPETRAEAEACGVSDSWFFLPANKHFWNTLHEMHGETESEVSLAILVERLRGQGLLGSVGGYVGVTDVMSAGGSVALFPSHLQELRKVWLKREAVLKLSEVRDNPDADLSSILDELREMNSEPIQNRKLFNECLMQALGDMEEMLKSKTCITGRLSGFAELDHALGGLKPGTLTVVGARPAMGKSIFGQNVALNVAKKLDTSESPQRVLFLTLEMSPVEIANRMIQQEAKVNVRAVVESGQGTLNREQMKGLTYSCKFLKKMPLDVLDVSGMNIIRISHLVESEHRKHPYALVVLDYLQLIKGYSKKAQENTVEQVAEVSQGLKRLAKNLNIPVVALAQVNREAAKGGKAPTLADLKGSGAIEQDSDAVILLHRPAYYAENKKELTTHQLEEMQLILAKNRHGETGIFNARFRGAFFEIASSNA